MAGPLPSLGSKLDGARAKVRRANEHIRALKQALQRFSKRDPYAFRIEPYNNIIGQRLLRVTNRTEVRTPHGLVVPGRAARPRDLIDSIVVRVLATPRPETPFPAIRWGTIVGEIVHNLASALENLVYELGEANPAPPQPPAGGNELRQFKRTVTLRGFPVCKERANWLGVSTQKLSGIDPSLWAVFQEAQPFYAWENLGVHPESHPLLILDKLWNRDKHRTVNLSAAGAALNYPNLELPGLFPGQGYLSSEPVISHPVRPIESETELAVIRVKFPYLVDFTPKMEVSVKPNMTLTILFGEGAPGAGENVFQILQWGRDTIVNLLNEFA